MACVQWLVVLHWVAAAAHAAAAAAAFTATGFRGKFLEEGRIPLWCVLDGGVAPGVGNATETRMIREPRVEASCGSWDVIAVVAGVHVFTAVAHAWYAAGRNGVAGNARWLEYLVSAPVVFGQLAVTTGTRQVEVLVAIVALVATCMPLGAALEPSSVTASDAGPSSRRSNGGGNGGTVIELDTAGRQGAARAVPSRRGGAAAGGYMPVSIPVVFKHGLTPLAAANTAWLGVGFALGLALKGYVTIASHAPDFVHGIVAAQAVLLTSFGVVGTWTAMTSDPLVREKTEVAYTLLSFAAKFVPSVVFLTAIMED
jgi:hypothetical protein